MSKALIKRLMSVNTDEIERALEEGADINERDPSGRTALMLSAAAGSIQTVHCLLSHGANIDLADSTGKTALHHAISKSLWQMMGLLAMWGADVTICDKAGKTPAEMRPSPSGAEVFGAALGHHRAWGPEIGSQSLEVGKLLNVFADVGKVFAAERQKLQTKITELQEEVANNDFQIEELQDAEGQQEAHISELTASIQSLQEELETAQREAATCRDTAEGLRRQLAGDKKVRHSAADPGTNYPAIADDDVSDLDTATLEACVASLQSALDEAQALHDQLPDPSSSIPTYSYSLDVSEDGVEVFEHKDMEEYSEVWGDAVSRDFIDDKWTYFRANHAQKLKDMHLAVAWPGDDLTADALKVCIEQIRIAKRAAEAVESAKVARIATSAARHIRSLLKPLLSILIDRRLNDVCAAFAAACACNGVLVPAAAEAMRALGVGTTVSFKSAAQKACEELDS